MKRLMLVLMMAGICAAIGAETVQDEERPRRPERKEMREERGQRPSRGEMERGERPRMSREEMKEQFEKALKEVMEKYDANKDGKLDEKERAVADWELNLEKIQKQMRMARAYKMMKMRESKEGDGERPPKEVMKTGRKRDGEMQDDEEKPPRPPKEGMKKGPKKGPKGKPKMEDYDEE